MNAYDTDYEEDQVLTLSMLAELVQHGGDPVLQPDSGYVVPIVAPQQFLATLDAATSAPPVGELRLEGH